MRPCAVMMAFHSLPSAMMVLCGYISCWRMIMESVPPTQSPITATVM